MYFAVVKFVQVCLLIFPCAIFCCTTYSQSFSIDSTDPAVKHALNIFTEATGNQSPVYNGKQYRRYPEFIHSGHPFFIADSLVAGSIVYEGLEYKNVPLLLDEVNDQLITTDLQGDNLVQLFKQNISRFTIGQHMFIHLIQTYPASGYYRVLYNGRSQIIVKETKTVHVKPGRTDAETERSVFTSIDYYLKTGTGYQKFNRLNSFLALLGKDRKTVAGFIRNKRLMSKAKEDLFYQAATFYDHLTN